MERFDGMSLTNSLNFGFGGLSKAYNRRDYLSPTGITGTSHQNLMIGNYFDSSIKKDRIGGHKEAQDAQRTLKASASHHEIYRSTTQLRTQSRKLDEGKNFMSQSFQGTNFAEINEQINLGSITQRVPLVKSQIYHQETLDEQIIRHKERI